jgi:xanthine dehydrogenase accessory factor
MPSIPRDPVCGQRMNRNKTHVVLRYNGQEVLLCCPLCQSEFEREPERYLPSIKRKAHRSDK